MSNWPQFAVFADFLRPPPCPPADRLENEGMSLYPTALNLLPDSQLEISWSDGQRRRYPFKELRAGCPCATCREKHGPAPAKDPFSLPVLSAAQLQPLRILGMKPIGNYAYGIEFSDGHDTGIYTFEYLRELGTVANT